MLSGSIQRKEKSGGAKQCLLAQLTAVFRVKSEVVVCILPLSSLRQDLVVCVFKMSVSVAVFTRG